MEVDILVEFKKNLLCHLIGQKLDSSNELRIFRTHNNKLNQTGDLSFPLNISGWSKYFPETPDVSIKIIEYIRKNAKNELQESDFAELLSESSKWKMLSINSCEVLKNKVNIYLNRTYSFKIVLTAILLHKEKYGVNTLKINPIQIEIEDNPENISDLTALRLNLLKSVTTNLLKNSGCSVMGNKSGYVESIYLTNKSESKCTAKKIVCGVVISNKFGKKNVNISAEEFCRKRMVDMQLMAQHKYGVRVTSESGWSNFFKQLGNAAVIIDLLHVKVNRSVIINEECLASTCSKGASFILYNCARLAEILKKFEQKIATKEIPPLPNINEIDFGILNQSEEWELLYVYLIQYPNMTKSCVADILECRLNTHNLCIFLDSLCSTFSVYYRRVRILTEPRPHLLPIMYARIHLIKGIQQVLHNALALLNIPPIKQM